MRVIYPEEMRAVDHFMIETLQIPGELLMENAAFALTKAVMERLCGDGRVFAVCATGNIVGDREKFKGEALTNIRFFDRIGGVRYIKTQQQAQEMLNRVRMHDVIVDALFGTGLKRPVAGIHAQVVALINASQAQVVSADIPSGIDAKTGQVLGCAVRADQTVTFQYAKPGHFLYPGREHAGQLCVAPIGVLNAEGERNLSSRMFAIPTQNTKKMLPRRKANTHKGTYGYLAVLAGAKGYTGAGLMCVEAALHTGAGVVCAGIPSGLEQLYALRMTQATMHLLQGEDGYFHAENAQEMEKFLSGKHALACGPGLRNDPELLPLIRKLVCCFDLPKVFDADALNLLARHPEWLKEHAGDMVLTPHPKEFSRLTGKPVAQILSDPIGSAAEFASEFGVTVLLKGATTVVASPAGEQYLVLAGTPGMAKGGSGDVLTGVIGAFLSQGIPTTQAAVTAAHLCGKAGMCAAKEQTEYSMTPLDTIRHLPEALAEITE